MPANKGSAAAEGVGVTWAVKEKAKPGRELTARQRARNHRFGKVRTKLEHIFRVVKSQFGYRKVRLSRRHRQERRAGVCARGFPSRPQATCVRVRPMGPKWSRTRPGRADKSHPIHQNITPAGHPQARRGMMFRASLSRQQQRRLKTARVCQANKSSGSTRPDDHRVAKRARISPFTNLAYQSVQSHERL
jgi:hypothetical protein